MARVPSRDTGIEIAVRRAVHARGLRFRKHAKGLPGTPDLVFPGPKVAVFVDGDFWHGWRFPAWRHTLTPYWAEKDAISAWSGTLKTDTEPSAITASDLCGAFSTAEAIGFWSFPSPSSNHSASCFSAFV